MLRAVLAAALLVAVLIVALARPRRAPEALVAVPAAALAVSCGLLAPSAAGTELARLGPTVGFLAAVLVLAHLADAEGVFTWVGGLLGRRPRALFGRTFAAAAVTTAVLSLDATVVLLTPVAVRTAIRRHRAVDPPAYACAHLANSASLLLPVSNLTNLLAVGATGLTFAGFAGVMALPWLAVLAVEYLGLRLVFRRALVAPPEPGDPGPLVTGGDPAPPPRVAIGVVTATLAGFAVGSPLGVEPVWVALAGAVFLGGWGLRHRTTTPRRMVEAASLPFCLFVLALGVVVAAAGAQGLSRALAVVLPVGTGFGALLGVAALSALLANVVNNLPATLLLLTALGPAAAPAPVLAMLIGVGVGPNLTPVGSLATLLWRRVLGAEGVPVHARTFAAAALATTPPALLAGTAALWVALP